MEPRPFNRWETPDTRSSLLRISIATASRSSCSARHRSCWTRRASLPTLPSGKPDPGLLLFDAGEIGKATSAFIAAIGKHRHFARETDPPLI